MHSENRIEDGEAEQLDAGNIIADDLLWRHVKTVPAFRALLRAVEARYYKHLEVRDPILDLGCGDGHFAQMAFEKPLAAGIDPWWRPLQKAQRTNSYRLMAQCSGARLPFRSNYFSSVISNSVLEHIVDVQAVLLEANRVLRPGGNLIMTVPSQYFTEYLGGALLFERLGLRFLANSYRRFFNRIARHAHTDSPKKWATRLAVAGFAVEQWQYYFSTKALHVLELGHVQGLPSAVLQLLTGHWILAPWRSNLRLTEAWLRPYYEEEQPSQGTMILILARKVSTEPTDITLPPPNPLLIRVPRHQPNVPDGGGR